ncbi:FAD-dependent oxidoreductase [Pseudooceanicola algae]|uniref:Nitric oxide reductase FlRd-NAD(+) reductase n=1 Tax=Pseudooceanicola algae TaxID=1537215 RepID=A0A418SBM2_9RHOB|nr:FAD-dependent oxidoreductase [Pseudooceanicola algae]QPM92469.1 Nitric oxide reductase FlRd-NAD(+) reductase [Pseudooceanicola algae]
MTDDDTPHIQLLGAGHANVLAVPTLRGAMPGARITLIDAAPQATYSGMFPGYIAGHYRPDDLRVELKDFAARHDIDFLQRRISGLDPVARRVVFHDGGDLSYDLAALDLGSHSNMPEIPGFAAHGVPIKPLGAFVARLGRTDPAAPIAIIGGGVAGVEIALALRHRGTGPVTLIEAGPTVGAALGPRARRHLVAALDQAGIRRHTKARVTKIRDTSVLLEEGKQITSRLTIGIAGARAHDWLARDLPVDAAGFVTVQPTLQVDGQAGLFAVGDCAAMLHAPRPKAGVFAVRQAPVLAANLIAAARGGELRRYDPQGDYLKIISLGGKTALAEWQGLTLRGAWLWRWKNRIDRRFMSGLQEGSQPPPSGNT